MAVVAPANADIVHILTLFEAKFEANNNEQQVFIVRERLTTLHDYMKLTSRDAMELAE